jgi:guanylate kinase
MIIVVSGPGGVGKGTVVARLVDRDPNLWLSRSWTTRAPRLGESDTAYSFVDADTFKAHVAENGFLEWAEFLGNLYGSPYPQAEAGSDVVLEIDVQGASHVLERVPDAVLIFLEAPSRAIQEQRLRGRGDSDELVAQRLAKSDQEADAARELCANVVVNGRLDDAVAEIEGIIAEARSARS